MDPIRLKSRDLILELFVRRNSLFTFRAKYSEKKIQGQKFPRNSSSNKIKLIRNMTKHCQISEAHKIHVFAIGPA